VLYVYWNTINIIQSSIRNRIQQNMGKYGERGRYEGSREQERNEGKKKQKHSLLSLCLMHSVAYSKKQPLRSSATLHWRWKEFADDCPIELALYFASDRSRQFVFSLGSDLFLEASGSSIHVVCTVTNLVILRYSSKNLKFVNTSHTFVRQANNSTGVRIDWPLFSQEFYLMAYNVMGARGSVVVKALCCKPEGRGFKSRWGRFFKLT
jgi:hypothetical protein